MESLINPLITCPSEDEIAIKKEYDHMRQVVRELKRNKEISPAASTEENIAKNRYPDVLPYEETRVKLQTKEGEPSSDYINANHVNIGEQQYICCQAPLPNTFEDFWRMVWEQNCPLIVMLTKLEEKNQSKADQYWPEDRNELKQSNGIIVTHVKSEKPRGPDIILRTFSISNSKHSSTSREVVQLHYTSWPDNGVPDSTKSMQELLIEVDVRKKGLTDPIVVHCSAGIGRTGTFIAIHLNTQKALKGEKVDVMKTVLSLRLQRDGMVQSADQYKFVYATLKNTLDAHKPHKSNNGIYNSFSNLELEEKIKIIKPLDKHNIRYSIA